MLLTPSRNSIHIIPITMRIFPTCEMMLSDILIEEIICITIGHHIVISPTKTIAHDALTLPIEIHLFPDIRHICQFKAILRQHRMCPIPHIQLIISDTRGFVILHRRIKQIGIIGHKYDTLQSLILISIMTKQETILFQSLRYIAKIEHTVAHHRRTQCKIAMGITQEQGRDGITITLHPVILQLIAIGNRTHIAFRSNQDRNGRNQEKQYTQKKLLHWLVRIGNR